MLVLSRKPGEMIKIGDHITLQVVAVSGNRVRIGIEAPLHVEIFRGELCESDLLLTVQELSSKKHAPGGNRTLDTVF